jgi:hypothetical protein
VPRVSIVTPVYNAARWLPDTISSVLCQSMPDWEQIFVDDGSTDRSVEIIEAVAATDKRFRLLRTGGRTGPAIARNLALDAAKGRYVAFLDADDLWLPDKLACCLDYLQRHECGFVYHDHRRMSEDGAREGGLIIAPEELNLRTLHTRRGHGGCLSVVVDRQRVGSVRFPADCPTKHEDFLAWLHIIEQGHIGCRVPRDLGRCRVSRTRRNASKLVSAYHTWLVYHRESSLPFRLALWWWVQYAWNVSWMYRGSAISHASTFEPRKLSELITEERAASECEANTVAV